MKKYLLVAKNTWAEITTYRLNFVMWRIRTILQLVSIYIIWIAVIGNQQTVFGYTTSQILTYILGTSLLFSIVLAGRNQEIGENINSGDLSIFLIKPLGYFKYWLFRDLGDKAMNLFFGIFEVFLFILLFKPPIFLQTNINFLLFTLISIILAVFLYFFLGCLLGLIGFWSPEIWAPRFLFWILVGFLAGNIFPLDILPKNIFQTVEFLPFTYLLFFPLKIYLGQLSIFEILKGLSISAIWIVFFYGLLMYIWNIGLKKYGAEGR